MKERKKRSKREEREKARRKEREGKLVQVIYQTFAMQVFAKK